MFSFAVGKRKRWSLVNAGKFPRGRIIGRSCWGRRDGGRWHKGPEENNCAQDGRRAKTIRRDVLIG